MPALAHFFALGLPSHTKPLLALWSQGVLASLVSFAFPQTLSLPGSPHGLEIIFALSFIEIKAFSFPNPASFISYPVFCVPTSHLLLISMSRYLPLRFQFVPSQLVHLVLLYCCPSQRILGSLAGLFVENTWFQIEGTQSKEGLIKSGWWPEDVWALETDQDSNLKSACFLAS